jgi:hypothetical protein
MARAIEHGLLADRMVVERATAECHHPATFAFLAPLVPEVEAVSLLASVDAALRASIRSTPFGSPRHFGYVEICRRAYKRRAMELDRLDKQRALTDDPEH